MSNVRIIETFGWHSGEGARRGELHLARMGRTALRLGYDWDIAKAWAMLETLDARHPLRVRMTLGADMDLQLEQSELPPVTTPWKIALAPTQIRSDDPWLGLKTTRRAVYDTARAVLPTGVDEMVFLNENNEICEGTIANIFVDLGTGLITPPVRCGLLPGILRAELLAKGKVQEGMLTAHDLHRANAIFLGNSLRGLIPAKLA